MSAAASWRKYLPDGHAGGGGRTKAIEPGTLYFAGPVSLVGGAGSQPVLSQEDRVHHSRPAIDYLFESAADAYGEACCRAADRRQQDGARPGAGQARGGLTVVQDPTRRRSRCRGRAGPSPA
jgi:two-component system chemotaxis response regulator CheB